MVEGLKDAVFTVLQCDRFHAVGVLATYPKVQVNAEGEVVEGPGGRMWGLTSPLAIRMRGERVVFDRTMGAKVMLYSGDWPVMATKVCPGEPFHKSILTAHAAIERLERVQASGLVIPGQEGGN